MTKHEFTEIFVKEIAKFKEDANKYIIDTIETLKVIPVEEKDRDTVDDYIIEFSSLLNNSHSAEDQTTNGLSSRLASLDADCTICKIYDTFNIFADLSVSDPRSSILIEIIICRMLVKELGKQVQRLYFDFDY